MICQLILLLSDESGCIFNPLLQSHLTSSKYPGGSRSSHIVPHSADISLSPSLFLSLLALASLLKQRQPLPRTLPYLAITVIIHPSRKTDLSSNERRRRELSSIYLLLPPSSTLNSTSGQFLRQP